MNIDEINGLLQQDDNVDILFLPLKMKIFVGFHSTWSFIKWSHECLVGKNQGGRRCGEVMSSL